MPPKKQADVEVGTTTAEAPEAATLRTGMPSKTARRDRVAMVSHRADGTPDQTRDFVVKGEGDA